MPSPSDPSVKVTGQTWLILQRLRAPGDSLNDVIGRILEDEAPPSVPDRVTITVEDDMWRALSAKKQPGDSFDDVLHRLIVERVDSEHY